MRRRSPWPTTMSRRSKRGAVWAMVTVAAGPTPSVAWPGNGSILRCLNPCLAEKNIIYIGIEPLNPRS